MVKDKVKVLTEFKEDGKTYSLGLGFIIDKEDGTITIDVESVLNGEDFEGLRLDEGKGPVELSLLVRDFGPLLIGGVEEDFVGYCKNWVEKVNRFYRDLR